MTTRTESLIQNVLNALELKRPHYVRSIFGTSDSWDVARCPPTEFGLFQRRTWGKAIGEMIHVVVPGLPLRPLEIPFPGTGLLFRPCTVMIQPMPGGLPNPAPDEAWLFINGICTDQNVVRVNARYIVELFGRPLTILYDSTCGIGPDLVECAVGKGWGSLTAAGRLALRPLTAALVNPRIRRVVLLSHSRGTIIAAAVLHALACALGQSQSRESSRSAEAKAGLKLYHEWKDQSRSYRRTMDHDGMRAALSLQGSPHDHVEPTHLKPDDLRKLEVYAIANCATDMRYVVTATDASAPAPYIESHGNENDLVARLGVLAKRKGDGRVRIDGHCYERPGAWGHFLNAHYLFPLKQDVEAGRKSLKPIEGTQQSSKLEALLRTTRASSA